MPLQFLYGSVKVPEWIHYAVIAWAALFLTVVGLIAYAMYKICCFPMHDIISQVNFFVTQLWALSDER